jgi:hypothetical protein
MAIAGAAADPRHQAPQYGIREMYFSSRSSLNDSI